MFLWSKCDVYLVRSTVQFLKFRQLGGNTQKGEIASNAEPLPESCKVVLEVTNDKGILGELSVRLTARLARY